MRSRSVITFFSSVAAVALAWPASADESQSFIQQSHERLERLLREPSSPRRETQIGQAMDGLVDYDEVTRRAFGEPCPESVPSCDDLWAKYDDSQREEVKSLLSELVRKNYRKNLMKTLDYEVLYRGRQNKGADTLVLTEAKSKTNVREPATRVDYVVKQTPQGYRVVDIFTEGSSLTKNYYDQFRKKMNNPGEGYPNIVQKLREKIAKKD